MLKLIIISVILVGLAIAGIAIKMFLKKDGEFQKSCGSVDPDTGQRVACTCGKSAVETCESKHDHKHREEVEFEEITG
ncbi:MAG: hypothetical protein ACLFPE_00290 [Bacteroidales bacterium]